MDRAQDFLMIGVSALAAAEKNFDRRKDNYEGRQSLPYAPEGVSDEYRELQRQSIANWLATAMNAPVQRMEAESITGPDGKPDTDAWNVFVGADLETRQKIVYTSMMVQSRGVASVSRTNTVGQARVSIESGRRVYLHADPEDPFTHQFAVKTWMENERPSSGLWVPNSALVHAGVKQVAVVYDHTECVRFEKPGSTAIGGWKQVRTTRHGLGDIPFVEFGSNLDEDGVPHSAIDQLIPMQDALNTIRFNTLLAMQFSAYRQRVATGYDPVLRDANGEIVYVRDAQGNQIVGVDGQPVPQLRQAGRVSVDRLLVFPGKDTKVFDLQESNLQNYVTVYTRFLTDLFSKAQVPPQYALDKMSNLSGDALAGADHTLTSLVADLKREANSGMRKLLRLTDVARGREPQNRTITWADTEPKSFAQIVDGVVKLIAAGFPMQDAFDMLPGSTPAKVERWMEHYQQEQADKFSAQMLEAFTSDLGVEAQPPQQQLPSAG
ncbi:portal protein [Gordonia phage Nyceirae]|uniref:Portal protein n=1 Tax=Gordonia phage Nyceirae TaxID=1887651 RepID=A0A1C9EHZ9_9CAUD|nr:portal protein [Gordonia phage Nyceirae]AON97370.1 portal protein [Gordonia phage Nyceirae]